MLGALFWASVYHVVRDSTLQLAVGYLGQLLRKERDESYKAKTEQKQNLQVFKQMINEVS